MLFFHFDQKQKCCVFTFVQYSYGLFPGWFYHAPARRQSVDPVLYPPMSQIPGLTEDDGSQDEPVRPLLKDTDSAYIRLAKQGGRASK